ncbi:TPA: hypothetical protein ACPY17_002140 [Citrobacter freundii]
MSTTPTNQPVPSESPRDLKFNAGKIDEFVTSEDHVYVDRFDDKHRTIAGINYDANQAISQYGYITKDSFEDSSTISLANECLRWKSNGEYYRWDGTFPKVVPPGSTPDTTGGVGPGKWVSVGDASLRSDLSKDTGAGLVHYDSGNSYQAGTVGDALSKTVPVLNLALFSSLRAAIESLPLTGGKIVVPEGVFEAGDWTYNSNYMSKPNVAIIGEKMPTWNEDLSALTGGSIIKGRFNIWAHNFQIENIGFDMGKTYVESKYPGKDPTTDAHPLGGTWDAFAFASPNNGTGPRRNVRIKNIVGLLYNSATVGHAVLMEGISEGSAENTVALYGVHGNVIKAIQFHAKNLTSYGQSVNGTIIKSDTYALCGDVVVDGTYHAKQPIDTTPWSTSAKTENAVCINSGTAAFTGAILINNTIAYDCANHIRPQGSTAISDIIVNGQKSEHCDWPVIIDTSTNCLRMIVDNAIWSNCTQGVFVGQAQAWTGQSQLTLKSVKATNITNTVFYAMQNGLIVIDELEAYNVNYLYNWQNGGKIYVGREKVSQLNGGNKFDPAGIAPVLGGGWSNYDVTNSQYDLQLHDYKARLTGLMKTSGTDPVVVYLPESMRPSLTTRMACIQNDAAGYHAGYVTIDSGVRIGEGVIPAGLAYVSLDGLVWEY